MLHAHVIQATAQAAANANLTNIDQKQDVQNFIIEQLSQVPAEFAECRNDMLHVIAEGKTKDLDPSRRADTKWVAALDMLDTVASYVLNKASIADKSNFDYVGQAKITVANAKADYRLTRVKVRA